MEIYTVHLRLREYTDADFDAIREYDSDPEVQRYRGAHVISPQQTWEYLQYMQRCAREQPRTNYAFAIEHLHDRYVIGWAPLRIVNPSLREAEVGWTLNRRYWGRGYGTETALALLGYGFEQLKLHRIWANCRIENTASWRIMEKVGMRREAHFREAEWTDKQWRDQYLYAILDHEWRVRDRSAEA